jgi:hypothetical protein
MDCYFYETECQLQQDYVEYVSQIESEDKALTEVVFEVGNRTAHLAYDNGAFYLIYREKENGSIHHDSQTY